MRTYNVYPVRRIAYATSAEVVDGLVGLLIFLQGAMDLPEAVAWSKSKPKALTELEMGLK